MYPREVFSVHLTFSYILEPNKLFKVHAEGGKGNILESIQKVKIVRRVQLVL